MHNSRKQYHSAIKTVHSLRLEKVILTDEFLKSIPRSTVHGWRHEFRLKKLYGHQFAKQIDDHLSDASSFLDLSTDFDRRIILSLLMVKRFFVQKLSKNGLQKLLRDNKQKIIHFVDWLNQKTGIGKGEISACIGLGRKTIAHWKRQVKHKCHSSAFGKCMVKNPNQATLGEIKVIKELLCDPNKAHWGIPSIQGWAIKKRLCLLSVSSWYSYNRLLNIRKSIDRFKKPDYKPLRANLVNEIWHADITLYKTRDGIKNYIYTIKDNFSRKTLVWKITQSVSALTRLHTIQKALKFAFPNEMGSVRLITDGGPENDNQTIANFIVDSQVDINHQIALKDIVQSNSMAEVTYRCLKSNFLYGKQINDSRELEKYVGFYLHDHDMIRPHSAHKIYTPDEVYNGADPNKVSLRPIYHNAAIERRKINEKSGCGVC